MGHSHQYSGGVIPYPPSALLPHTSSSSDFKGRGLDKVDGPVYQNSGILAALSCDPPPVEPKPADRAEMISTSRSVQCILAQQQQQQQEQQRQQQLDQQLQILHIKMIHDLEQTKQQLRDLQRQTQMIQSFHHPSGSSSSSSIAPPSTLHANLPAASAMLESTILLTSASQSLIQLAPAALPASPAFNPMTDRAVLESTQSQLAECGWYHGHLSWQESNSLLQHTAEGTFLLRDSQHPGCMYSLAVNLGKHTGPTSIRINFTNGKFVLDAKGCIRNLMPAFNSVGELVEFYVEHDRRPKAGAVSDKSSAVHINSPIVLRKPFYKAPSSLAHLTRLAVNRCLKGADPALLDLPPKLVHYITAYRTSI